MTRNKIALGNALWMIAGAAALLAAMAVIGTLRPGGLGGEDLTAREAKYRLAGEMRIMLTRESEAEKSAVMAETDEESIEFANQARTALAEVDTMRGRFKTLMGAEDTAREREAFETFSKSFVELAKVDEVILDLAVKNTNLKAHRLAFGPAAQALADMERSLDRLAGTESGGPNEASAAALACGARLGALRVQAMLAPHIAESSDEKMDEMERAIAARQAGVTSSLDRLAGLGVRDATALAEARNAYARYAGLVKDVITLSRENTNVRSLDLSLNQKRKIFAVCQDALAGLQDALPEPAAPAGKFGRTGQP